MALATTYMCLFFSLHWIVACKLRDMALATTFASCVVVLVCVSSLGLSCLSGRTAVDLVVLLLGHSFVGRFAESAVKRLADVCQLYTESSGGGAFARLLASPTLLLVRLRAFAHVPDILVIDLGTNDPSRVGVVASGVVDKAMALLEMLRRHHLLPQHVVFLSVVQRTASGCCRVVPVQTFNHRAKLVAAGPAALHQQGWLPPDRGWRGSV